MFLISSEKKLSENLLKKSLFDFLQKPIQYRKQFLQKSYQTAFDGYSFLGQKDSLNQYDFDSLHSFVISEFTEYSKFPEEFHQFFRSEWESLQSTVRRIELEVISNLNIPGLKEFYEKEIGHMISCNYYPQVSAPKNELRLSEHKDVSLFTVFLFGNDEGFHYKDQNGQMINLGIIDQIVLFPGYLMELLTQGKVKAIEHQVDFSQSNNERFSFAFFSIPKPNSNIHFQNIQMTGNDYYEKYLALF